MKSEEYDYCFLILLLYDNSLIICFLDFNLSFLEMNVCFLSLSLYIYMCVCVCVCFVCFLTINLMII